MKQRRYRYWVRAVAGGKSMACALLLSSVLAACDRQAEQDVTAAVGDREAAAWREEAGRLLARTSFLRRNEGHPEWEHWTADDLRLESRDVCALEVGYRRAATSIAVVNVSYVRGEDTRGFDLYFAASRDDGEIWRYVNQTARSAAEQDQRKDGPIAAALTFGEAAEKAKEYVRRMMGNLPADLALVDLHYGSRTPLWHATFTRYEGWIPYNSQHVRLVFSERYGVAEYNSSYFHRWEGSIRISPQDAIRKAQTQKNRIDRGIRNGALYSSTGKPTFLVRRPPYILSGHPYLLHVAKNDATKIHAVWFVAFPYQWLSDEHPESQGTWNQVEILVDAETGEILPD
ncbi:MAG: hypothetical protein JW889_02055 [Verrucomicrobia bacterium]|nr:hypothetical protein [Verrucomicrobiota bacterium]